MYIYHQPIPSLDFFWNNPILMKGGREVSASGREEGVPYMHVPNQPTKIKLRYLA